MKYIKVSGEKIREARKSQGLTQAELGKMLNVSSSMIGQYETEARRPSFKTATAIANALKIDSNLLVVSFEADDLQAINVAAISLEDWKGSHPDEVKAYTDSLIDEDTVDLGLMALHIQKKQMCSIEEAEKKAELIASCIQQKELSDDLLLLGMAPKEIRDIVRLALQNSAQDSTTQAAASPKQQPDVI